ncbi:MAG: ATP-binding protein [Bacteroidales bacterium]
MPINTSDKRYHNILKHKSAYSALKISLVYFVISFIWIFFSDKIVEIFAEDTTDLTHYQTVKGVMFIMVSALIIFGLIYKELKEKNTIIKKINESEQKYRTFIKETQEGIYRFELKLPLPVHKPLKEQVKHIYQNAYLAECNEAFAKTYGYTTDELLNLSLGELQAKINSKGGDKMIVNFILSGYQLKNVVNEEVSKQGEKLYVSKNITGIIIDNKIFSAWSSQSNITEQKKYEEQLKIAKEKAEESDKLKSAFLANMSHEIRTPLNGILGFSYLLSKEELKKSQKEKFNKIIKHNGQQLLNIINDILDISKIEVHQLTLYNSIFPINELIKEIETLYLNDENVVKKQLAFTTYMDLKDKSDFIIADRERIMQILQNLIDNAIKFTDRGKIECGYLKKGNELKFYVADTGKGISKTKRQEIFKRFSQEENTQKQNINGTGLGLSISKGLVELMGGEIWVDSELDKGSTFYFTIPFKKAEKNKQDDKAQNLTKDLSNKTILIVEDDYNSYILLKTILKDSKCKIIHVDNGYKAIDKIKQTPEIDLILMDIRLPHMDGLTTTKEIKKIRKDIKVIAQSAYAMAEDKEKTIKAGCEDLITKPIDKEKLLNLVHKFLT